MKHILIALTLFVAAPVSAQSLLKPNTTLIAALSADMSTTITCLRSNPTCHEMNPLLKWAEPAGAIPMATIGAVGELTTLYLIHRAWGRRHGRLMRIGIYGLAGAHVYAAIQNYRSIH